MKNIIEKIRKNYLVDGENQTYADYFENAEQALEETEKEVFEENYEVNLDEIQFPIIVFDDSGASNGRLYDVNSDVEEVLESAEEYFEKK